MMQRLNINKEILILTAILIVLPFFLSNGFYYEIAILSMLNAMICIGLNLLMGYAGQVSLGHGAFAGLGGYMSAILATNYGLNPLLAIFISIIIMGIFAFIISKPILKLHGHYLAMATLGVGIIINIVLTNETELTGGTDGMSVDYFTVFGFTFSNNLHWYILIAIVLVLTVWAFQNLIDSPFGRALRSLHDSEKAASCVGINVANYKSYVFVISVVSATIAGSLYAFFSGFISPVEAGFHHSIELVVMVVLGGLGRLYGAIIGAALLTVLPQLLTAFEEYETMILGIIIIAIMIFMPKGIASIYDFIKEKFNARSI